MRVRPRQVWVHLPAPVQAEVRRAVWQVLEEVIVTILIGIVGAVIGGFVVGLFVPGDLITGINITTIVVATLGAIILLALYRWYVGRSATRP